MERNKFVIAIYAPSYLNRTLGGAYTYIEVLIEFLLNVADDELSFKVVVEDKKTSNSQDEIVIDYTKIKYSFKQRLVLRACVLFPALNSINKVKKFRRQKKSEYIIRMLNENKVDIIYYPNQHSALTQSFPFVINNWDLAHITVPLLPDTQRDLNVREKWYNEIAVKALSIFSESDSGKLEIEKYLNIHENRIKVFPIFPGKVIDIDLSQEEHTLTLKRNGVVSGNFFFYPAQFWALKNHYNLLVAISLMDFSKHIGFKIIFCGSDKGNMDYIKKVAIDLGIEDRLIFLGFISTEELHVLYKNCSALVFPSLLGPTNMPILEAMYLGTPILCSNLQGHKEMLPDYRGMFDPLDPKNISDVLQHFIDDESFIKDIKIQLIKIKERSKFNRSQSFILLIKHFKQIKNFRKIWDK